MKLFAAIVLAFACTCANATSGTVHGTVTNTIGQPITVGSIQFTVNGASEAPVSIDNFGMYSTAVTWPGGGPAACTVQAKSPGFVDQSHDVNVPAGGSVETDFILTIDPDYIFSDAFESAG